MNVLTGRVTEWFGASINKQTIVFHGTFHFNGTDLLSTPMALRGQFQVNWNHGANPLLVPPHHARFAVTCR